MRPLVITGPTAGGKSALAMKLAESMPIEIISMDSMAVFKNCPIVTAQSSEEEKERCVHHLTDFVDPENEFSTAQWKALALEKIEDITKRNKIPILVGGTFLYLSSLVYGVHSLPEADDNIRNKHQALFESEGPIALWEQLQKVDSESAEKLHHNDFKRVSRALEIFELTGKSRTEIFAKQRHVFDCNIVFINWQREEVYKRCNDRVLKMIDSGLIEEIRSMSSKKLSRSFKQAVGVKEVLLYIENKINIEEMISEIQKKTRHLAKHQYTWSKRFDLLNINPHDNDLLEKLKTFCNYSVS